MGLPKIVLVPGLMPSVELDQNRWMPSRGAREKIQGNYPVTKLMHIFIVMKL